MTQQPIRPPKTVDQARQKAYAAAERTLRTEHALEFSLLYQAECAKAGISYRPRLTPEQKAQQTVDQLIAEFPNLRIEPLIDFGNAKV